AVLNLEEVPLRVVLVDRREDRRAEERLGQGWGADTEPPQEQAEAGLVGHDAAQGRRAEAVGETVQPVRVLAEMLQDPLALRFGGHLAAREHADIEYGPLDAPPLARL